ncbi:ABC transporter substrate-binding protein [Nesterenkonia ebinurensis]|uniref:ABC transporter substrate-binding protein n=1 Tax=Nesterenkonia ebinurensis TaxID=2608252 RepID=UPI00168A8338|nr:ABC transporter substrate-binding protein [Nesterenkonia ebinurensis]
MIKKSTSRVKTLAALAAVTGLAAACGNGDTAEETNGNGAADTGEPTELTLATVVDISSYDPAELRFEGEWPQLWMPVYDTLLKWETDGSVSENLATSWEYNEDNTVLSIELRDDVTFIDGEPFNAEAVQANIEHFLDGTGVNRFRANAIESVEVTGDYSVDIILNEPDPTLLNDLGSSVGAMASPAALDDPSIDLEPVGSGPYTLNSEETVRGDQYVFERKEDYWDPESWAYDRIVIRVMSDLQARMNALSSGQVQGGRIDIPLIEQAEGAELTVHPNRVDWFGLAILDREGEVVPALAELEVRQAINIAFDRAGMLESIEQGQGVVSSQIIGQSSPAYDESLDEYYEYDLDQAQALMEEAGYADGFTVPMMDYDRYSPYQPYVEQAFAELNIEIDWVPVPTDDGPEEQLTGDYPILIMGQQAPESAWDGLNFAYEDSFNVFEVYDDELTEYMEAARATDGDEQVEAFRAANEWLVENAWFSVWYHRDLVYATADDVEVDIQPGHAGPQIRNYRPAE